MSLLPQAPIRLHHLLEVAAHVRREAPRLDEEIVHANAQDSRRPLDEFIARRVFLLALDARPVGRRSSARRSATPTSNSSRTPTISFTAPRWC